jgi:hypothetical protein
MPASPVDLVEAAARIIADYPRGVRNGLPTTTEIRAAMRVLQIPLYSRLENFLDGMTEERQRTVLLAVLNAYVTGYGALQDEEDRLNRDELAGLIRTAESEINTAPGQDGGDPTVTFVTLGYRLSWAGFVVEALGDSIAPESRAQTPVPALLAILRAATYLVTDWLAATVATPDAVMPSGGDTAVAMQATRSYQAKDEVTAALKHLKAWLPTQPPKGRKP